MLRSLVARLKTLSRRGHHEDHARFLLPFLIITIALGVMAARSYQLSLRVESGANALAHQFASTTAEIAGRRLDTAVKAELFRVSESWQQVERGTLTPSFTALQQWLNGADWIVSAIYVPDADPTNSVFVSELPSNAARHAMILTREFYTSSGTVRYNYDPARLLARCEADLPVFKQRGDVTVVTNAKTGLMKTEDGFSYVFPLAPPLNAYATRAIVRTSYMGSGWENQRVISLWVSLLALILTSVGALLAARGLRKESETMKLRGALIANVSHELRTPLSMIRLGAETLKRGAKLKEKERLEIEDQILREVLHLSHLVENVLDVARMQHNGEKTLAVTPVHPRELVTMLVSTYESWIRSKGFTVTLQIDESIEAQLWDREAVSRALLNLIDNAIKYSADDKAIEVCLRQDAAHVVIEVRDHGIGIDSKDLGRIFQPYYRATFSDTQTRRGAGLGLTLVQQIMASHGGRVEVESESGAGSTFRLLFPRLTSEEAEAVAGLAHPREAFLNQRAASRG